MRKRIYSFGSICRLVGRDVLPGVLMTLCLAFFVSGCGEDSTSPESDDNNYQPPIQGMSRVTAGTFTMGDGDEDTNCGVDEREVTLTRDFLLGQCEVTNQEYLEAVQWAYDHGHVTATETSVRDYLDGSTQELLDLDGNGCEISFSDGEFSLCEVGDHEINPDHPVKEVTWYGAVRYCDRLSMQTGLARAYDHDGNWLCNNGDPYGAEGYRLSTDAEWEYAAQYNDERIYPWGSETPDCDRANYSNCLDWTVVVGTYADAPASLDLSDMAGNMWEWCNDGYVCNLGTDAVTDPVGQTGTFRVLHGGSWSGNEDWYVRCAYRIGYNANDSNCALGFRVAKTASP